MAWRSWRGRRCPAVFDTPSNQADHNVFDVSLPVADELVPFVHWIASLPPSRRPKTAAYPMAQDPFADPPVQLAQTLLSKLGVKTVYNQAPFTEEVADYKAPADQVAGTGADLVVLGSTDVPTVAAFMTAFEQQHYTPKLFIAAAGPDQGASFTNTVGVGNADGMMVPNGWYPGYANAASQEHGQGVRRRERRQPVRRQRGRGRGLLGRPGDGPGGHRDRRHRQREDHHLPAQRCQLNSVQGPVKFDALGENGAAAAFIFQWQKNNFNQVLPVGGARAEPDHRHQAGLEQLTSRIAPHGELLPGARHRGYSSLLRHHKELP